MTNKINRVLLEEFATNESYQDTIMGLLVLSHTLAKAIMLHHGSEALTYISNDITDSLASSSIYSPEIVSVISSNLRLITAMLNNSVDLLNEKKETFEKTRENTGDEKESYW